MGCFSVPVRQLSSTRIFARPTEDDRQLLVCALTVEVTEDVALVLPIPVPSGTAEDAVTFVDLSSCPGFFDDLDGLFPSPPSAEAAALVPEEPAPVDPGATLAVHEVGDWDASFVPSPGHFHRLEARFRPTDDVWDKLPRYHDHAFCVFKLRTRRRPSQFFGLWKSKLPPERLVLQPMAFEFPRRDPGSLFYPTVHVLDGVVHPTADFDHELYCQTDRAWEPLMDWQRSERRAGALETARAWLDPEAFVWRRRLRGELPNRDTSLAETKLRTRTHVTELFRLRMCAAWEHLVDDGKTPIEPHVKKWMRVGEGQRIRIRDAVRAELLPVFESHRDAWGLAPFAVDEQLPLACVTASNDRIEPQEVHVVFAREPSPAVLDELQLALQSALDRATSIPGFSLPPPSLRPPTSG